MRWPSLRRPIWWLVGAALALPGVVALVMWLPNRMASGGAASASQLDTLHALCVQDMVANTCKVMGTVSAPVTAKPGDLVFVAGVGPIDAVAYQQMHAAGDAMCSVVRAACARQWDGSQCMTARSLYQR